MTRMWLVDPYHVLSTGEEWVCSVALLWLGFSLPGDASFLSA